MKSRKLVESLETRRLFAASVALVFPGYYEITPDAATNSVAVSVDQNAKTFSLEGTTYGNVQHIVVNGNNNGDSITVTSNDENGVIDCAVNGGSGNDTVVLQALPGVIHGGNGNDTLTLQDSYYGEVYGDGGFDHIYVKGDTISPQIQASSGGSVIDASQNNFGVTIQGSAGNDTLIGSAYDDAIYGDGGYDYMYGMGGNDTFYSTGGVIYGGSTGTNVAYVQQNSDVTTYNVKYVFNS